MNPSGEARRSETYPALRDSSAISLQLGKKATKDAGQHRTQTKPVSRLFTGKSKCNPARSDSTQHTHTHTEVSITLGYKPHSKLLCGWFQEIRASRRCLFGLTLSPTLLGATVPRGNEYLYSVMNIVLWEHDDSSDLQEESYGLQDAFLVSVLETRF